MKKYSSPPVWWFTKTCDCLGCSLVRTPFGKHRRILIMSAIDKYGSFTINKKNTPQYSCDPDLRRLVKQGKLKLIKNTLYKVK